MPVRALTQWQLATEVSWGTPVSPMTVKLMGIDPKSSISPDNKTAIYQDVRNGFQGTGLAGLEQIGAKGDITAIATFEDLPYFLDNALGQATPTGTGPYVRAYALNTSAIVAPRIWTIVYGNSQTGGGVYTVPGALLTNLKFTGKTGGPLMLSAGIVGKNIVTSGSLAALSDRAVTPIMGQPWVVKIDTFGGTMGSTSVAATAVAFEIDINLAREMVRSVDALAPDTWEQTASSAKLNLTLRFNATTKAMIDAIVAQTAPYQAQVQLTQTNLTQICQFQFAGTMTGTPKIYDDQGSVLTTQLAYDGTYNTGAFANSFKANITNSVAALV